MQETERYRVVRHYVRKYLYAVSQLHPHERDDLEAQAAAEAAAEAARLATVEAAFIAKFMEIYRSTGAI